MKTLLKTVCSFVLVSAASATMLFALPHAKHARNSNAKPHDTSGGSIALDSSFNAPFFATPDTSSRAVPLPDGKYVIFFNTDTLADQSTGALVRFNADGTLDTTFSFSKEYASVSAVAPWFDLPPGDRRKGKSSGALIVATSRVVYGVGDPGQHQVNEVLRLNDDGSVDPTFGPAMSTDGGEIRVLKTFEGDPRIFVGGRFTAFNGQPTQGIVRLLGDGSVDPAFAPVSMTCGANPFGSNGCGLWTEPVVVYGDSPEEDKILIGGDFVSVNGVPSLCVAQLNADGTLDTTFNASGFVPTGYFVGTPRPIRGIGVQSDGSIIIGGRFNGGTCANHVPLVRLNPDGSRDDTYGYFGCLPPNGLFQVRGVLIDYDDHAIALGISIWRFNLDGSLDSTFHNPQLSLHQQSCAETGICPEAYTVSLTDGGKSLFVGGLFTDVDDVGGPTSGDRWGVAKFSATDGSLDPSFTTSRKIGNKIEPGSFLRRSDGSVSIAFSRLGENFTGDPAISHDFGRLLSNGSLDNSFDPIGSFDPMGALGPGFLCLGLTPLTDGSLLLTGKNGSSVSYGHLLPNGNEDSNYQADSAVHFATALQRGDGKVVLSGFDAAVTNINNYYDSNAQGVLDGTEVQRINADGSRDVDFTLTSAVINDTQDRDGNGALTDVYVGSKVLALLGNGQVLFGYYSRDGLYHLLRLDADGSVDPSFQSTAFPVTNTSFRVGVYDPQNSYNETDIQMNYPTDIPIKQAKTVVDGKIVLMGSFASYAGTTAHGMVRINPDGSLDPTFSVGLGAQWIQTQETSTLHPSIDNLEVGLDSKLLLTGTFEAFNGTAAPGIINLNPDGTIDSSFVPPVKRQKYDYQPAYLKRQPDGSFLLSGPYSRLSDNDSPSFFRLVLPPGTETPPGTGVTVGLGGSGGAAGIDVTFGGVNDGGSTSVAPIDPNWAGQLPPGYQIGGTNLAFEIYTTANYTPPVTICFDLSSLSDTAFAAARVLHNAGDGLVDVTSSKDAMTKMICATVNSLSPFLIANPTAEITTVVSRKVHGATPYDVTLFSPESGDGVECRSGGFNGDHQLIVNFALPVTFTNATASPGSVVNTSTSGAEVTVNLTGVPDAGETMITFHGASAGGNASDVALPLRFLVGDTNGDGAVNSADISQTKSQTGQPLDTSNFREDVNVDAALDSADVSLVKSRSGTALPNNSKASRSSGRNSLPGSASAKMPIASQLPSKSNRSASKLAVHAGRLEP